MGVTGSSANSTLSASLPELCARVRKVAGNTPIAVGFGVNTRDHFLSVGSMADGVVIGSRIVSIIREASPGNIQDAVREYCREVSRPGHQDQNTRSHEIGLRESIELAKVDSEATPTAHIFREEDAQNVSSTKENSTPQYQVS